MLLYFLVCRIEKNILAQRLIKNKAKLTMQTLVSYLTVLILSTLVMTGLTVLGYGFPLAQRACDEGFLSFAYGMLIAASDLPSWASIPRELVPLITAIGTTIMVFDHANSQQFQEIRLTPLPSWKIVWGYIWASLFKWRSLVALTLSLCLNLLVRNAVIGLGHCGPAWEFEIRKWFLMVGPVAVLGVLVRLCLAVTLGTVLGLRIRSRYAAVVIAVIVFLIISVGQIGFQPGIQSQIVNIATTRTGLIKYLELGMVWAILMMVLSLLSILWALYAVHLKRTAS